MQVKPRLAAASMLAGETVYGTQIGGYGRWYGGGVTPILRTTPSASTSSSEPKSRVQPMPPKP